jgi:ribosomal protein L7/L12
MVTITSDEIAARAYQRFLERGGQHGHDIDDWLAAKEELRRGRQRYEVQLVNAGARVIEVVRTIRELTGMDLRDVKDIVDAPPGTLWREAMEADAETIKVRLESLGARVDLLPR